MAGSSDNTDLLFLGGAAALLYFYYSGRQAARQQQQPVLVGQPVIPSTPVGAGPVAAPVSDPTAQAIHNVATAVGQLTASIIPIPIVGPLAAAEVTVGLTAITETIGGNLSTGNILTDVALLTGPLGWSVLGIGKLLGIDLFGHPLDQVNDVLLNKFTSPTTADNVQYGTPIWALDADGVVHQLVNAASDPVWAAHYSWREIIAVDPIILAQFPVGTPISDRGQIKNSVRPAKPEDIWGYFGRSAIFKIGDSQDLYGTFPGMHQPPAGCCTPLPGSPYDYYLNVYLPKVTAKQRFK